MVRAIFQTAAKNSSRERRKLRDNKKGLFDSSQQQKCECVIHICNINQKQTIAMGANLSHINSIKCVYYELMKLV